jgi:hypothetical protein
VHGNKTAIGAYGARFEGLRGQEAAQVRFAKYLNWRDYGGAAGVQFWY